MNFKRTLVYLSCACLLSTLSYAQEVEILSNEAQLEIEPVETTTDSIVLYTAFRNDPTLARIDSMMSLLGSNHKPKKHKKGDELWDRSVEMPSAELLSQRIDWLNEQSQIDLDYNSTVDRFIQLYVVRKREQVSRMLGEAEYYYPLFEQALEKHGLPLELKHLAVVESALNPAAISSAKARGLWQFMLPTGRMYGLQANNYTDDRQDPALSTEAACLYLKDLYGIFGDWQLALAAYNSGPGNVRKAIRKSGGKTNFWEISPYLPRETRGYVPAFIAVNYAMSYATEHQIYAQPATRHLSQTDTVHLDHSIYFTQLAHLLNTDVELLHQLNPRYKTDFIPASTLAEAKQVIYIPTERISAFTSFRDSISVLATLEAERRETLQLEEPAIQEQITHRVRRGESLGRIANKYNVSVSDIKEWNRLRSDVIHSGQRLSIFTSTSIATVKKEVKDESDSDSNDSTSSDPEMPIVYHKVEKGDTLYNIAQRYPGVSANNIMEWNDIANAKHLKAGMRLKILKKG